VGRIANWCARDESSPVWGLARQDEGGFKPRNRNNCASIDSVNMYDIRPFYRRVDDAALAGQGRSRHLSRSQGRMGVRASRLDSTLPGVIRGKRPQSPGQLGGEPWTAGKVQCASQADAGDRFVVGVSRAEQTQV
jgi:hypothetical protein